MKFMFSGIGLLLIAVVTPPARHDFAWSGHGTVSFDVPASWSMTGAQAGDTGFNFRGVPRSGAAAILQISLLNLPADKPLQPAELPERLHDMMRPYIISSVEGKFTAQSIKMEQGSGCYVQFTDASLVGQPPQPGNYKVMRNGLLLLDEHTLVVVTMQFDDPKAPEAAEMLALASSMRFKRGEAPHSAVPDTLSLRAVNGAYEITIPQSKLVLVMAKGDLTLGPLSPAEVVADPRYFFLVGPSTGLAVSGWFEPSARFKGMKEFWASEAKGLVKGGQSAPTNVTFLKCGDWDVVTYEMKVPKRDRTFVNLRAELVQADTWIDLHYSLTANLPPDAARDQLLAILKANQIRIK